MILLENQFTPRWFSEQQNKGKKFPTKDQEYTRESNEESNFFTRSRDGIFTDISAKGAFLYLPRTCRSVSIQGTGQPEFLTFSRQTKLGRLVNPGKYRSKQVLRALGGREHGTSTVWTINTIAINHSESYLLAFIISVTSGETFQLVSQRED